MGITGSRVLPVSHLISAVHTLVLDVAVAVPCSAHSVMFSLVFAGASFSPKQTAWLVNNSGQSLQRLQGSIYCVGHVGTKPNDGKEDYVVILHIFLRRNISFRKTNFIPI